jgi:RimJ/RimL family protein N-acetyltransferase
MSTGSGARERSGAEGACARAILRDAPPLDTSGRSINSRTVGVPIGPVETARLQLRVPELGDAEALMGILWDPEVVERKQVTLVEPPGGLELALKNTKDMRGQWELRGYGQWSVVEKATGQLIGVVGVYHPQKPWPGPDLGWAIHRDRWGRGLATEAAAAALGWMWDRTPVDRVISLIAPDDRRSIRIAVKIGQRFERAGADPVHGEPVHVYAIDRP